jgi:hypothetical protein
MNSEADWQSIRGDRGTIFGIAGMGILRITLLFGSAAVALALILAPIADSQTRQFVQGGPAGLDRMTTGSVPNAGRYTIRRSVLQDSPNAICIIRDNGSRSGDCG